MIVQILNKMFGDDVALLSDRQEEATPDVTVEKDSEKKIIVPMKFRDDVERLEQYLGTALESGLCITATLTELLSVCPRTRRRIDAFNSLIEYLRDEMNVTLIIKTSKK